MKTRTHYVCVVISLSLLLACTKSEAPPPSPAESKVEQNSDTVPNEKFNVVPHAQTKFLEMWAGLKNLPDLTIPTFGMEGLHEALKNQETPGSVKASDFKPKYLYQDQKTPHGIKRVFVVYSDFALLKEGTTTTSMSPLEFLKMALYDPHADGVVFNPKSSVCEEQVFSFIIDKFYITRLIGFLLAPVAPKGENHLEAQKAIAEKKRFEAAYYTAQAYEEGEPWEKAELAKVQAWHELDFPGAQTIAKDELLWFMGKYGENAEGKKLLAAIEAKTNSKTP